MSLPYTEFPSDDSAPLTCCQRACPVGTDVATYIALIAQGRFSDALAIVREENPFPGICGRVCDHECETHCRRGESDAPVAIRLLKRFVADYERSGKVDLPAKIEPWQSERVAIVGSGPAGLTAASDLLRRGYGVTVFEALPKAGGMMRVGIPDYRLPPEILDFDLEYLYRLGVKVELNKTLGRDFTLADFRKEGYKAILLATGAHGSSKLKLEGAQLPGVNFGIDFLRQVNLGEAVEVGKQVVVIGGGDVAMDTARTALRLGAEQVDIFCLESRDQMPAHDWETKEALDEQIQFNCGWGPVEIIGDDSVRQVRFVACTSVIDSSGKFAPTFDTSRSVTNKTDMVLTAIGQFAQFSHSSQDKIKTTPTQLYQVDSTTLETTAPEVFAAGDATYGTATVIQAIASGHKAAASICEYLQSRPLTGQWQPVRHQERVERIEIPPEWEELPPLQEPELPVEERVRSFSEVKLSSSETAAIAEAARCMRCDCETDSYSYSRAEREMIYHLARDIGDDEDACLDFLNYKLTQDRSRSYQTEQTATLDDLVFLPANLTRLVIDPYRESCRTRTVIGPRAKRSLEIAGPVVIGGLPFSSLSENELIVLCEGARRSDIAIRVPIDLKLPTDDLRVIRVVASDEQARSLSDASAVELTSVQTGAALDKDSLRKTVQAYRDVMPEIPIGQTIRPGNVFADMQAATEAGFDFVTLMAMEPSAAETQTDFIELKGLPRIDVLTEGIRGLRAIKREEEIDILYFGGVRGGCDTAKVLALCGSAVLIGYAALIAAGDCEDQSELNEGIEGVMNFVSSVFMETSILARCCGKTDVHNLEPEDLRSLSVETSSATAIPLVGKDNLYSVSTDDTLAQKI